MSVKLVLLRHGQSDWNLKNLFTGWTDVDLTEKGVEEAHESARLLAEKGLFFDIAFTSVLRRAIRTLWIVMDDMDRMWVLVHRAWRLNERHYGDLQGLDKAETAARHGDEQVHVWRRSYDVPPPEMAADDPGHPHFDPRYAHLDARVLPGTESLALTLERVLPYWHDAIAPRLKAGETVLVTAHGNSLRALVKYLAGVADDVITGVNIPTGIPLRYRLDGNLNVVESGYLGDAAAAEQAAQAVADQARAK